jgi:hypothetical protein
MISFVGYDDDDPFSKDKVQGKFVMVLPCLLDDDNQSADLI